MTEKKFCKIYESPQAEVIDICLEGVLCGSSDKGSGTGVEGMDPGYSDL